jgi:uncharacterized membrane protein
MYKNEIKKIFPVVIIEDESVLKIILKFIEHNSNHYVRFNIHGKTLHPCARCFGYWIGIFSGFFFLSPFWLGIFQAKNFLLAFLVSWIFALPSIIDWSTVKLGIRKGNNNLRAMVGFLHGVGVIIYFFVMPAGILFKITTYSLYSIVFFAIRQKYHFGHYKSNDARYTGG